MAGILANSVSVTMTAGDTAADKSVDGYLVGEQVALATSPAGSSYQWSLAKPSGATSRADLNDTTLAGPVFTPDVGGYYVLTCIVDSTTVYVMRLAAVATAATTLAGALRLTPLANVSVPTPPTGATLAYSDELSQLVRKTSGGVLVPLTLGVGALALADADATLNVAVATHYVRTTGPTALRTLTLDASQALTAQILWLYLFEEGDGGYEVVNGGPGAGTLTTLDEPVAAKFRFDGTNWTLDEVYPL